MRDTGLTTEQGFAAEARGEWRDRPELGIPVSTTHAIVRGGGAAARRARRWVSGEIATSWLLTLPATILFGYPYATDSVRCWPRLITRASRRSIATPTCSHPVGRFFQHRRCLPT
jgi:hypothetical protein